jgi:sugar/nucleoside kinase (ribokinase family)
MEIGVHTLHWGGEIVYTPPAPCVPIDTHEAGDAYAGGILYSLLQGIPILEGIGDLAARVAAAMWWAIKVHN